MGILQRVTTGAKKFRCNPLLSDFSKVTSPRFEGKIIEMGYKLFC